MTFEIVVEPSDYEIDEVEVSIGQGMIVMTKNEWEAFRTLLQPSTKADFTIEELL